MSDGVATGSVAAVTGVAPGELASPFENQDG
jgi:hypothetical protein